MKFALYVPRGPRGDQAVPIETMTARLRRRSTQRIEIVSLGRAAIGLLIGENDARLIFDAPNGNRLFVAGQPILPERDLRTVLRAALAEGATATRSMLRALDGAFAAVFFDAAARTVTIVSDRLGLEPVYCAETPAGIGFASGMFAAAAANDAPATDPRGFSAFLRLGNMLGESTWVRGVARLASASECEIDHEGRLSRSVYWRLPAPARDIAGPVRFDAAAEAIEREVAAYHRTYGEATLLLSGGFDSRFIAAALHRLSLPTRAMIVAHPDLGNADGRLAAATARRLGIPATVHALPQAADLRLSAERYFADTELSNPSLSLFISRVGDLIAAERPASVWDGLNLGYSTGGFDSPMSRPAEIMEKFERLPTASLWRAAQKVFTPAYVETLREGWEELRREVDDRFEPSIDGVQHFLIESRLRRRIAVHTLKALANDTIPFTPGGGREFLEQVLRVPVAVRHSMEPYIGLFRERYAAAGEVPIVSGAHLYAVSERPGLRFAVERSRARFFGNWRVQAWLRRFAGTHRDAARAREIHLQRALAEVEDDARLNADEIARLRREGLRSFEDSRAAELLGYWSVISRWVSRPAAF